MSWKEKVEAVREEEKSQQDDSFMELRHLYEREKYLLLEENKKLSTDLDCVSINYFLIKKTANYK